MASPGAWCAGLPWLIKHMPSAPRRCTLFFTAACLPSVSPPSFTLPMGLCVLPTVGLSQPGAGLWHGASDQLLPLACFGVVTLATCFPVFLSTPSGSVPCFPGCSCPLSSCFGLCSLCFPRLGLVLFPAYILRRL